MNDQPNASQFRPKSFGAPPISPKGADRMLPWMRTAMTGGLIVTLGMYGAQLLLPEPFKPSVVMGRAAGDAVRGEIEASREAKIDLDRRVADATAQASAKAQADVIAIQKALEERSQGLAGLSSAAAISDWGCILGQGVAKATDRSIPAGMFRPRDASDGWNDLARTIAGATCGLGNVLRQEVTQSQLDTVRQVAVARGAPMQNGAVPAAPLPLAPVAPRPAQPIPAAAPTTLDEVYAITQASRHYPMDEVMKARTYIRTLPQPVQDRLFANLDDSTGTSWDVLVDRTRAYVVLATLR